eukprot:CAMPEP_0113515308 /NCGR_PEP_ID=MMETSP0014_2-20120614/40871_1 /TAXON_ID=2857 /ORGANISM="Nitzschia sp." /LENGTH=703 /DNA_ID=CAMNT_0000411859 /DNA_START=406 /DNA_END=2513 /DNA_ORIENTATION=- /assembly_acc=CAM_ASM_000159
MTGRTRMYSTLSNENSGGNEVREEEHPHPTAGKAAADDDDDDVVVVVENDGQVDDKIRRRHRSFVGRGRHLLNKVFAKKKRRGGSGSGSGSGSSTKVINEQVERTSSSRSCGGVIEKNNLDFFAAETINASYSSSKSSSNSASTPHVIDDIKGLSLSSDPSPAKTVDTSVASSSLHSPWILKHNESHESINFFQNHQSRSQSHNQHFNNGGATLPTFPVVPMLNESSVTAAQPGLVAGPEEEPATNSICIVPPSPTTGTEHQQSQQRKQSIAAFDPFEVSSVAEEETDDAARTTNENDGYQQLQPNEVVIYTEDLHKQQSQPQHTETQQSQGGRSLYKKTMSMKQTVRGLLVSRRKTSESDLSSKSSHGTKDDPSDAQDANVLSDPTSEEQKQERDEERQPQHQYVIRMESRIRSNGHSLEQSKAQSKSSNGFSSCTGDITDAVKNVGFDDDVLDAIELSNVELNQMVRKISRVTSEPILATMTSCGTPAAEGTPTANVPSEESIISYTPTWQQSVSNKWNSFISKTTPEDGRNAAKSATGREDEKEDDHASSLPDDEDLGYIPTRYSMAVNEPVQRSSSRLRKQHMTTKSEQSNPTEKSFIGEVTNFFGSVNDGLVSIADDVQKTNWLDPNTMMEFVDCLNPNPNNVIDVSEKKKFPLDDPWLSTNNDSDSISKLTNPQELERSEMSSLSGIPRLDNPIYDS